MAKMISCKICGKLFESNFNNNVCDVCKIKDDEIYKKLREYLMQHPRTKIFEVATELDIPIMYIKRYLREERLEIVEKNNYFLKCEICGEPIRSGFCCNKCALDSKNKDRPASPSSSLLKNEQYDGSTSAPKQKINYVKSSTSKRRISI